jgi:pSer/pThr/pTyr-binding forkhead associated (FHA) protein
VAEAAVSREHAELVFDGSSILLRDLGSSNGTYVNQEKVEQQGLTAGDVVGIGSMAIVVRIDGMPTEIDPEEARKSMESSHGSEAPTSGPASAPTSAPAVAPRSAPNDASGSGLLDDLDIGSNEDSSVVDFDFDFDDDDDDQPAL